MNLAQDNLVSCIQLDTTWSVLQQYVTSIPTIIVKGVGIPIGFQFGLFEDAPIYNDFFSRFEKVFGFKINDYITIAQSDQGTALVSAVEKLKMRHLLVSLKKSKFKSQISKLVSVVSTKDYDELKHEYETNWKTLDIDDVNELNKYLSKIGFVFKDKKIKVSDSFRWENCSMQKRAAFKMPSCTNQIESGHGHLNAAIPRRNRYFSSIKRLIDGIIKRNKNYFINFHQHYANHKRKILNIIKAISDEIMTSAIQHYETDPEKQICKCGESISSEMDVHIPCSHLLHFGIEFPEIEAP